MASNRIGRINEEIQRELSSLIPTVKDPRVTGMISVTSVNTTPDLKFAKIYVSVLDKSQETQVLKGLKSAGAICAGSWAAPEPAQHPGAVLCPRRLHRPRGPHPVHAPGPGGGQAGQPGQPLRRGPQEEDEE